MLKRFWPYIIILFFLAPLIYLTLRPGFWVSDDGGWMVIRLSAFHQTLRSGQFPVRFLYNLNRGYGYPVMDFLYPLPFYLGEIVHLLGFGFVDSVKILFTTSFIFGAYFMYRYAGLVAAAVYTFFPYRIFDVYSRGSLGEAVAFAFIPAIFYFLDRKQFVLAAIFTAALITSHNTLAFLFLPVVVLYLLVKRISLIHNTLYLILSLCLSAWFWLPALYDLQYVRAGVVQVADFTQYFANYLDPLVLLTIVLCLTSRKNKVFVIATLMSLFFSLPISASIWQYSPLPRLVQFPWRFLAVTTFLVAVLSGQLSRVIGIILAVVVISFSFWNLKIDRTFHPESYYTTNDDTTTVKNEYMPKWVKTDPTSRPSTRQVIYFPGIKVVVAGQETDPQINDNGVVTTNGNIVFRETPLRFFADGLSLVGLLVLGFAQVFLKRGVLHEKQVLA